MSTHFLCCTSKRQIKCKMLLISLSLCSFVSLWTRAEYLQSTVVWHPCVFEKLDMTLFRQDWNSCHEIIPIKESFLRSILSRETSPVNPILTFSCIYNVYVTVSDLCIHDNMTECILCVCVLQTEIAKRLNAICAQVIPFLSQEVRLLFQFDQVLCCFYDNWLCLYKL